MPIGRSGRVVIAQLQPHCVTEAGIEAPPTLTPFIKWPGGKSDELLAIAAAAPPFSGRYIDPFVGGGSVLLATPPDVPAWANDACADLVSLYEAAAARDQPLRSALDGLGKAWAAFADLGSLYSELATSFRGGDVRATECLPPSRLGSLLDLLTDAGPGLAGFYLIRVQRDLPVKLQRMRQVQVNLGSELSTPDALANLEGAIRAAFYMAVRCRYNDARLAGRWDASRSADFLFLREFAYAAMFRFNAKDEFNVPYGGVSYNRKSFTDKIDRLFSPAMRARLSATTWRCLDFEPFLAEASPNSGDFVFIDPPYDTDFSAYDNRPFGWRDQERLARVLDTLPAQVMVVIKDTPMIRSVYAHDRWRIVEAPKTYMWTIKSRNDREATHLTITNY
jgi:DNA adenine methylase